MGSSLSPRHVCRAGVLFLLVATLVYSVMVVAPKARYYDERSSTFDENLRAPSFWGSSSRFSSWAARCRRGTCAGRESCFCSSQPSSTPSWSLHRRPGTTTNALPPSMKISGRPPSGDPPRGSAHGQLAVAAARVPGGSPVSARRNPRLLRHGRCTEGPVLRRTLFHLR